MNLTECPIIEKNSDRLHEVNEHTLYEGVDNNALVVYQPEQMAFLRVMNKRHSDITTNAFLENPKRHKPI